MFVNYTTKDYTLTRVSDDTMLSEDVQVVYGDNLVILRQYNEKERRYETIELSPKMYVELMYSFSAQDGTFTLDFDRERTADVER